LTLTAIVGFRAPVGAASSSPAAGRPGEQPPWTLHSNVQYCTLPGAEGIADIYTPLLPTTSMPLVIFIHGGGWVGGDKSMVATGNSLGLLTLLTSSGYVVASINYRLAPANLFPDQIEDVKCAVRSFRSRAASFHIDPTRIAAWGSSAGGHLANMLGTTDASAGFDVGDFPGVSSRVESVIDWFGPTDLNLLYTEATAKGGSAAGLIQTGVGSTSPSLLSRFSPVTYVTSDDAPTTIQHGALDDEVYSDQATTYTSALEAASVLVSLTMVQNATHDFAHVAPLQPIVPSLSQIQAGDLSFLNLELKNNPNPRPQ
jgi:acetyl esterase/lipase